MKNSEIHNGLDQKEIRDFLAMSLVKEYDVQSKNKKDYSGLAQMNNSIDKAIAIAKADIKFLNNYVKILENERAIIKLIENNGWQEHDVSDETDKDMPYRMYMSFIGTEEEYIDLIARINK